MTRKWIVEIDNNRYSVQAIYGELFSFGAGKILVGAKVVNEWAIGPWLMVPNQTTFEIAGKKAILKRTGFFIFAMDLSVPEATKVIRTQ
jgi:hypothetical protein